MTKYLKQITTGNLFVWTQQLSERPDMVAYAPEPEPVQQETPRENSETEVPEIAPPPTLQDAVSAFRKDVGKLGRKPKQQTGAA